MSDDETVMEKLVSRKDLEQTYKKNNVKYIYKKIVKQDLEPYIEDGWEKINSKNKEFFKLRKLKDFALVFEDEVWCILYKMGFDEMNKDHNFSILRKGSNLSKQIDVFARDDQCICVVECKAAEKPHTKRSLDKDIDQLAGIHHEINLSIFSHYKNLGNNNKFKIIWILALKNIDISENDRERAKSANIKVIDESMINYYSKLSNHFGRSSKYQFLADMFPGRDIPELIEPVPALKGKMGNTDFYSFVIEPEKLLKIAYIAHRAKTNEEDIDTYQRMAKKSRLNNIAEYIQNKGIFPTSIVINIEADRPMRFDQAAGMAGKNAILGTLYLPNKFKTAWIIDGQHRLFAYSDLEEAQTATLPVIAFENLDSDVQAKLFVDINGEQVKVPKNLLSDLYATIHWNSINPKDRLLALTSRLIKELNDWPKSPLRDRIINIEGHKTKTRSLTLTAITTEINKSRMLGSIHSNKAKDITPGPLFQEDLDSSLIKARDIISGYYSIYLNNEKVRKQWEFGSEEGGYICTNQGIISTLRVLKAILDHLENKDLIEVRKINTNELLNKIEKYVSPIITHLAEASPKTLKEFREQYGEGGYKSSTFALFRKINEVFPNFEPSGFQEYLKQVDTSTNTEAYEYLLKIELMIQKHVVNSLKLKYGDDYSQWWHHGVKDTIKNSAMAHATQEGEYKYFERYIYLINLKEIIEDNWDIFGETYTIDAKPSESKKKRLDWYTKVNSIRNKVDHPPKGGVTDEQLEYVIKIYNELRPKLEI